MTGDFIYHTGEDGCVVIDGYSPALKQLENTEHEVELIIPDLLDGRPVTVIGEYAFECCDYLKRIVLPRSLKRIEECAFWNCRNLTEAKFDDSLEYMGNGAFYSCPLSEVYLSAHLKNSITELFTGDRYVPMESRDDDDWFEIFTREELKAIRVSEKDFRFTTEDGVLFDKDKTTLLCYPSRKDGISYTVPDGITVIGRDAFYESRQLQQVILPDTLKQIEDHAFFCSGIEKIRIPDGVKTINKTAFQNCNELKEIYLPKNLEKKFGGNLRAPTVIY